MNRISSHLKLRIVVINSFVVIAATLSLILTGCSDSKEPIRPTTNDVLADTSPSSAPSVAAVPSGGPTGVIAPTLASEIFVQAGTAKQVTLPDNVTTLDGYAVGKSVIWSVVNDDGSVSLESPIAVKTRAIFTRPGNYTLRLTATSFDGNSEASDVQVSVKANPVVLSDASTPLDHLKALDAPHFKSNHTLLPLSQWSCGVDESIRVELLKHWGYSAQFGRGTSLGGGLATQIKANPGKYPVEFSINALIDVFNNYDGSAPGLPKLSADTWLRDANGATFLDGGVPKVSPLASDAAMFAVGQYVGQEAAQIEQSLNHPISMINNGGEYGLWVLSENDPNVFYGRDPRVLKAFQESGLNNWYDYNAKQKARQEKALKAGIYSKMVKSNPYYSWYQESYGPARGRWWGWEGYNFRWENYIDKNNRPMVSDFSSPEMYYAFQNSGWTGFHADAMVPMDALTGVLKNAGGTVKLGQKYFYPWVSMGWDSQGVAGISESDLYVGMMKMYYTLGAIGAVSGDFTCGGKSFLDMYQNNPVGKTAPTQIKGFYLLSHVHALFSHLQPYVANSSLLPGPNVHPYSALNDITAAMEFPVDNEVSMVDGTFGKIAVPTARVVARKTKDKDQWLITAWANTGNDRNVTVTVDSKLGKLTLLARRAGSVYLAEIVNQQVTLRLIDQDAMNPTKTLFP